MTDRRRINGPLGGTSATVYSKYLTKDASTQIERPMRSRAPNVLRKMCTYSLLRNLGIY
jgi:exosome complex component MTR3